MNQFAGKSFETENSIRRRNPFHRAKSQDPADPRQKLFVNLLSFRSLARTEQPKPWKRQVDWRIVSPVSSWRPAFHQE